VLGAAALGSAVLGSAVLGSVRQSLNGQYILIINVRVR